MNHLELLVQRWRSEQSLVLPPAPASDVISAFAAVGGKATADVIALYGHCGGMEQMDNSYWRLWPLAEVVRENSIDDEKGILFGDYLISSWCYRLRPRNGECSAVYLDYFSEEAPIQVAPSMKMFIERLWRNPDEVLEPGWVEGKSV